MIDPWDIHDILAFSKMLVSDSQTMTIEASVLGIPSVRINSFFGKSSVIEELENKYELTFGFHPNDYEGAINRIQNIIENNKIDYEWAKKRKMLLRDKVDFNNWLIQYFNFQFNFNSDNRIW